jgi:hypothetical protein
MTNHEARRRINPLFVSWGNRFREKKGHSDHIVTAGQR